MPTADYNANLLLNPTLEDKVWGLGDLLRLEDQAGIERAIIVPACQLWPDNEGLAKAIRGYNRFTGCAIINPQFGEKAALELERCVLEWGIKGLKLMPTFHGYPVHTAVVDRELRAGWIVRRSGHSRHLSPWSIRSRSTRQFRRAWEAR